MPAIFWFKNVNSFYDSEMIEYIIDYEVNIIYLYQLTHIIIKLVVKVTLKKKIY